MVTEPVRSISGVTTARGLVLVVDDYDDARQNVSEALESAGYKVAEAQNGQQALNFMVSRPQESVSLIVLDLQMPVMDGWHLLDVLRCYVKLANIPVIIVTAQDPHLDDIRHPSVAGCLRAPYEIKKLIRMVDDCLSPRAPDGAKHRAG
ncbi:MAG TPA: response regulator [Polyangiaceae bacterium]|nr:response regulator [Polyangiaceae bacterium]